MLYNTKYICSYKGENIFLDSDQVNDDEKKYIIDVLYSEDLLHIFEMDQYNEEQLNISIHNLYEKIKNNPDLQSCMTKLAEQFMSYDNELGLMILFSFDYLYLTHICISELLDTSNISDENIQNLKNKVFQL